jgi:two-component system, NtrC family, response regulator AtoC
MSHTDIAIQGRARAMVECRVLFVDDDELIRRVMERGLSKLVTHAACVHSPREALLALDESQFDIVVTDLRMADHDSDTDLTGITLIKTIKERHPDTEIILQTGFGSIENAQRATRAGAYDYIEKPYKVERLIMLIERALQHRRLRKKVMLLKQQVAFDYSYDELLGDSMASLRFKEAIATAAEKDAFILISGAKGTGKSTAAKIIHHHSLRRRAPLLTFDCAGTPKRLIDSELFGAGNIQQGATSSRNNGLLSRAAGGTFILKDVEALPKEAQRKLFSVLQAGLNSEGHDSDATYSDVRIIATTSVDLATEAISGAFSAELLKLLEVTSIEAPTLSQRIDDILPLAKRFLRSVGISTSNTGNDTEKHLSSAALEKLMKYTWPNNIAELKAVLRRASALAQSSEISADDIFFVNQNEATDVSSATQTLSASGSLEMTYRTRILKSLEDNKWNYSQTAVELGIGRTTLWRKVKKYNLTKELVGEQ